MFPPSPASGKTCPPTQKNRNHTRQIPFFSWLAYNPMTEEYQGSTPTVCHLITVLNQTLFQSKEEISFLIDPKGMLSSLCRATR
jgi:hypothetical protein